MYFQNITSQFPIIVIIYSLGFFEFNNKFKTCAVFHSFGPKIQHLSEFFNLLSSLNVNLIFSCYIYEGFS